MPHGPSPTNRRPTSLLASPHSRSATSPRPCSSCAPPTYSPQVTASTQAIALYVVYNVAATVTSFPACGFSDRLGQGGPLLVTAAGVVAFLLAYPVFSVSGPVIIVLAVEFTLTGIGIGCAETAEHAAVAAFAPVEIRGSAFGLLATVQAIGNVAASAIVAPTAKDAPSLGKIIRARHCIGGGDGCEGPVRG